MGRWDGSSSRPSRPRNRLGAYACLLIATFATGAGCLGQDGSNGVTGVSLGEAEQRILFVGNSLTYTNDLPGAVATVAAALGNDVAVASVAYPNYALQDHWYAGFEGLVTDLEPDLVVMQQGPSSLPENQLFLATWADTLSRAVRAAGGEPALLMVWPSLDREFAFDDVRDAYHDAAVGVGGTFLPAGEALRVLHTQQPDLSPFGPDGFHPSDHGTVLAAYVIAGTLFGDQVLGLDARLDPGPNGGRVIALDESAATALQTIADSVVAAWR